MESSGEDGAADADGEGDDEAEHFCSVAGDLLQASCTPSLIDMCLLALRVQSTRAASDCPLRAKYQHQHVDESLFAAPARAAAFLDGV